MLYNDERQPQGCSGADVLTSIGRLSSTDSEVHCDEAWGRLDLPGSVGPHHGSGELEYGLR